MKKFCLMILFVAVCVSLSMSNVNIKAGADSKCEVKFMFDGLQAIAFGNPDKVTDGILEVHHHTPKLEIKEIKKGKEKVIFNAEGKDLYKKVLNITVGKNLNKPTRYYSSDMAKDRSDFRWCLDIENDLFQKQLYLKEDKFYTKINFQAGKFVTDHVTSDKYQFVSGSKIHSFNREIGAPGAHINLTQGSFLVITGLEKTISLPYSNATSYTVNITNLPSKDMMNMDHFSFYYQVIETGVPEFMPIVAKKAAFNPRPFICGPLIFSKSNIN